MTVSFRKGKTYAGKFKGLKEMLSYAAMQLGISSLEGFGMQNFVTIGLPNCITA
jgi:hypothetical protein